MLRAGSHARPPGPSSFQHHSTQALGGCLQRDLITCFASVIFVLGLREILGCGNGWKGRIVGGWRSFVCLNSLRAGKGCHPLYGGCPQEDSFRLFLTQLTVTLHCETRGPCPEQDHTGWVPWRLTLCCCSTFNLLFPEGEREQCSAGQEQTRSLEILGKVGVACLPFLSLGCSSSLLNKALTGHLPDARLCLVISVQ